MLEAICLVAGVCMLVVECHHKPQKVRHPEIMNSDEVNLISIVYVAIWNLKKTNVMQACMLF